MESEDYEAVHRQYGISPGNGKLNRKERETINIVAITKWCIENDVSFAPITSYQIRISNLQLRIDIFPQTKKYHNITKNERGIIKGKIIDYLKTNFL